MRRLFHPRPHAADRATTVPVDSGAIAGLRGESARAGGECRRRRCIESPPRSASAQTGITSRPPPTTRPKQSPPPSRYEPHCFRYAGCGHSHRGGDGSGLRWNGQGLRGECRRRRVSKPAQIGLPPRLARAAAANDSTQARADLPSRYRPYPPWLRYAGCARYSPAAATAPAPLNGQGLQGCAAEGGVSKPAQIGLRPDWHHEPPAANDSPKHEPTFPAGTSRTRLAFDTRAAPATHPAAGAGATVLALLRYAGCARYSPPRRVRRAVLPPWLRYGATAPTHPRRLRPRTSG